MSLFEGLAIGGAGLTGRTRGFDLHGLEGLVDSLLTV
jgi:hypothetical protein